MPLTTAGAIGLGVGAASLIGSAINSYQNLKSQADTNETNYKIWQEQLAAQKEQWKQEQANYLQNRKWQLEDVADQRRYDSPQSQKARYLAAGINPYLANSMGQTQTTSPPPTPPNFSAPVSAPQMHAAQVDYGFGLAAQNAANTYFAASQQDTDIAATRQRVQNETLDTLSKIAERKVNSEQTKATMNSILQDIRFNEENWQAKSDAIKFANDKIRADQMYIEAQTEAQRFANQVAPELNELQKKVLAGNIASAAAQVAELSSRTDLNNEQKDLVTKKITEQVLINGNLPKKLHNDNAIQVATYREIKAQAASIQQRTETEKWNTQDAKKFYRFHLGSQRTVGEQLDPIDIGKAIFEVKKK